MNHSLLHTIAKISYRTGVVSLFYLLNKNKKRIITFHNVLPSNIFPKGKRIGLTNSLEEFELIISEIAKRFNFSTNILDNKSATITFDDGYFNQFYKSWPILKKLGDIPAIIFISGNNIGNKTPSEALIVDLLMHWIELVPTGTYMLPESFYGKKWFTLTVNNRKEQWEKVLWPAFCLDSVSKGEKILDILNGQYPISKILESCDQDYLQLRLTGLDENQLKDIRSEGWIIGWHTKSHYPLSYLSIEEQAKEIGGIDGIFKDMPMSYPYGESNSVSETNIQLAKQSGYPCAVSNLPDPQLRTSLFFIPRYTLEPDKYLLHFELSGLKHFLKTGKLLHNI